MPLSEVSQDSFASFIEDVFLESPDAMWYDKLPSEKEIDTLFNAKIAGCSTGSIIDLVFQTGDRLVCECEVVKVSGNRAVVGQ